MWKLSVEALTAKNVVDLEVGAVDGVAFTVEVADGIGQSLVVRKGPRGAGLVIRGLAPAVTAGAPPFHYVTVRADRSNPEVAYQLKVTGRGLGTDPSSSRTTRPTRRWRSRASGR